MRASLSLFAFGVFGVFLFLRVLLLNRNVWHCDSSKANGAVTVVVVVSSEVCWNILFFYSARILLLINF